MKRVLKKPIYAIITSLVLILGTFALILPYQEAKADHEIVVTSIVVEKKMVFVTGYSEIQNCESTTFCGVLDYDTLNKRDYNRFLRWCDSDMVSLRIPDGDHNVSVECDGPGPWRIVVSAGLFTNNAANFNNHGMDVLITVHPLAP